jgi:hypothetical protein
VADDLAHHPALAPWRDRLLVQAYCPGAWAVAGVGLQAGGRPTLVLQDAPGPGNRARVLHRQDDYAGGAAALAGALRRADPSYDPATDPDLRRPAVPDLPCWASALLGSLATLLLRGGWRLVRARRRPAPPPR